MSKKDYHQKKTPPKALWHQPCQPGKKKEERQLPVLCSGSAHLTGFHNLSRSPGKDSSEQTPPPHWAWVMPPGKDLKHIHLSPGPSRAAVCLQNRWESLLVWLLAVLFHSINIYWGSTCARLYAEGCSIDVCGSVHALICPKVQMVREYLERVYTPKHPQNNRWIVKRAQETWEHSGNV